MVPFSLDKRPEGKRLIYSGRYSASPPLGDSCARPHPQPLHTADVRGRAV